MADDRWNPFAPKDLARPGKPPSTSADPGAVTPANKGNMAIERSELEPVLSADGSGLPAELWRGLDLTATERLIADLDLPPGSATLTALWRRLLTAQAAGSGGTAGQWAAARAEGLFRSGLLTEASQLLQPSADDALLAALAAKVAIARGDRDAGCAAAKVTAHGRSNLPNAVRGHAVVMTGYCAAVAGDRSAAGLAAELAREEGVEAPTALAALEAFALGQKFPSTLPKRLSAIDYRLLRLLGPIDAVAVIERAEAALIAALVQDEAGAGRSQLAAVEAAARLHIIEPERLAEAYGRQSFPPADLAAPLTAAPDPLTRRALLYRAIAGERTPQKRARAIRALLDDGRRSGLYLQTAQLLARAVEEMPKGAEIGWFAETAIEIMVAAGKYDAARAWERFAASTDRPGNGSLRHWLALADIAEPDLKSGRGASLPAIEPLARRDRLGTDLLHRLATALDALDYDVPLPLWEAASRTPQPGTGHLPGTGILTELQDASRKKELGRTVLLAMAAIGPGSADGAHIIALGDVIRALKRVGLEGDARRLAFEALFASWPRGLGE